MGKIVIMGLPSTAASPSRAMTFVDARAAGAHQPTVGVFSPNETDLVGLSWDGSNTTAYLKTLGASIGLRVNATDYLSIIPSGALTIGAAATTAITLTTDGTGDGEVVLPGNSVGNAELVNSAVTVTAGAGLINGGSASLGGSTTLDIASANGGIVANANDIALTVAPSANGLSATTSSGSGMEILASGLTLLQGCADTQILKWNETTDVWDAVLTPPAVLLLCSQRTMPHR